MNAFTFFMVMIHFLVILFPSYLLCKAVSKDWVEVLKGLIIVITT